MQHTYQK